MKKTVTRLADGRELLYYDSRDDVVRDAVDRRPLDPTSTTSEIRHDPLLGDAVAVASHRQGRTYHPPADECPLCPSRDGRLSEIPDSDYDVVVFENRFPSSPEHPAAAKSSASPPTTTPPSPPSPSGRPPSSWTPGPTAPRNSPNFRRSSRCSASRTGARRSV